MADPFSIFVSTLSIVDVSVKVVGFLIEVKKGTDSIDDEINGMIREIESLKSVSQLIHDSFQKDISKEGDLPITDKEATVPLWQTTGNALQDCLKTLKELLALVEKIRGDSSRSSTLDKFQRYFRKLFKEGELHESWQKLHKGHEVLQILLTAINITYTRKSQAFSTQSFADLSASIQGLGDKLGAQVSQLEGKWSSPPSYTAEFDTRNVLATAHTIKQLASLNMHFDVPQSVSSMFTGRQNALDTLKQAISTTDPTHATKRFVVYGLPGSGKTQFCCKFAQENRQCFWGIFYVDASTPASAKASYADIADKAKIEPNERSVKYWLSIQRSPWLLLLDNVDEREGSDPENYFPECETGLVILTTRNHSLKTYGNIGPRFFEFKGLEQDESTSLLLTCAGQSPPFTPAAVELANGIGSALGFLPLALVQAGRAVLKGKCTLQTCLAFFTKSWARVRSAISTRMVSFSAQDASASNEAVFCTYEMVSPAASPESIELLKLLSFMDRRRFPFEILVQAVLNPSVERESEKQAQANHVDLPAVSLQQTARDLVLRLYQSFQKLSERSVLPKILRAVSGLEREEIELHLREALSELRSIALIDYVDATDSYSVHPLVHWWVRESMLLGEQAIWCQSASTVLAHAILLPPASAKVKDNASMRRLTLDHIEHVKGQQQRIREQFLHKQRERRRPWPILQPSLGGLEVRQMAKFALVYAEGGQYADASRLLMVVDDFLSKSVGLSHPIAIRARLFLSEMQRMLGDEDKAAFLQLQLLEACTIRRGRKDVETLSVLDKLGISLWQQGKFREARKYQEEALRGFREVRGSDHTDTYKAMTHYGTIIGKLAQFDEAVELHQNALDGLRKHQIDEAQDQEILEVMESLAMARYDRHRYGRSHPQELEIAQALQIEVMTQRETLLRKDHPWTLLACCHLARIKGDLGNLEEADHLFRSRLPIVEMNMGETHIGTLFGKAYFGYNLVLMNKLSEAQEVLELVVREHERNRRDHPDQLVAAAFLLACYNRQGKKLETQVLQTKVIRSIHRIFGEGSPWERYFLAYYSPPQATSVPWQMDLAESYVPHITNPAVLVSGDTQYSRGSRAR